MGYDVELVQIAVPSGTRFPVDAAATKKLRAKAGALADPKAVRQAILAVEGCRPGPGEAVDYMGRGLSYARFTVGKDAIRVENDCSVKELLKVYQPLAKSLANLRIFDLQSQQLHSAESFLEWWSKPL